MAKAAYLGPESKETLAKAPPEIVKSTLWLPELLAHRLAVLVPLLLLEVIFCNRSIFKAAACAVI